MLLKFKRLIPLILLMFFQGCASHFFQPDQVVYRTPAFYELKYDDIYFNSKDKTSLHAWRIYPSGKRKGLVFVAHGNAQNLSSHFQGWLWLIDQGYEVFIFDYRGYGKSEGKSSIEGSIEDTKAALNYVDDVYEKPYVAIGQSLGGTMLLNAVEHRNNAKIKALVIDSTFMGFSHIVKEKMNAIWFTWPFQWIASLSLSDEYDSQDKVQNLGKPLLFVHGSLYTTVSVNASWNLFELATSPRELWIVKNARHIQCFDNKSVQKDFLVFLKEGKDYYKPNYSSLKIYE
ncbi:MAG TPA: alpha/beta fold hydrolase [Sulfurimonas sp.]|nr:alpha/beta fold hydrolase [Sulfurimonas sp.]